MKYNHHVFSVVQVATNRLRFTYVARDIFYELRNYVAGFRSFYTYSSFHETHSNWFLSEPCPTT